MGGFAAFIMRELRISWRSRAAIMPYMAYPILLLLLFVFAIDVPNLQKGVAPALVLLMVVLSAISLAPRYWQDEWQHGVLPQLALRGSGLVGAAYAKYLVQLVTITLPLALAILCIGQLMLGVAVSSALLPVLLALPVLVGLGVLSAALTLGRETGLLALILLPLYVPTVILLALAVSLGVGDGVDESGLATACLYWLGALAALAAGLCPLGAAYGLKQQLAS